jgi:hypothetical protein
MKVMVCRAAGCRRKPHAQGLCQQHYDRQRKRVRRGDGRRERAGPAAAKPAPAPAPALAALDPQAALAGKFCCVPGCTAAHHAKGYCKSHYGQLRRHGTITGEGGEADGKGGLSKDRRLLEIIKRHEILKKEISSIHKELESEAHED